MSASRRYLYGAAGILPGIVISRITGFHIFTAALYAHPSAYALAWDVGFAVGGLLTLVVPLWFWVARPVLSGASAETTADEVPGASP